ncbi:MAG: hypothetical protein OQK97_05295 [Deltaproteobacteria bacterium]|jgi:hypothetical protein|nr:hypothetical protein [Deltaproteobacteria bacterium]
MFWFIVLLLIVGAGFYFYQKMMTIEREIRAEQDGEILTQGEDEKAAVVADQQPAPAEINDDFTAINNIKELLADSLESLLQQQINQKPGMAQSDIYSIFPDVSKKKLQQVLKEMADEGRIKRKKQGSSYLLSPGE